MSTVYLIPAALQEDGLTAIPSYITDSIRQCAVFFVENERTTRRYFKQLWKTCLPGQDIVIDDYEWINMTEDHATALFREKLKEGKIIGIVSEAGCPGVADPGQALVAIAQEMNVAVKPLVGPSSILLALMASGMNGQQFKFNGYLPIDNQQRVKALKELEAESAKKNCTQLFIETPYRNNQLIEAVLKTGHPNSLFCIAVDLTGPTEWVKTKTIAQWQKEKPELHKRPAIFLLQAR
ncbi:MAG: SAM-dependent methyltransferase [Sphingobacteriales bacterium]|nr:SAM-dependent methyltransferase [Sphingobacteriales bacterium]